MICFLNMNKNEHDEVLKNKSSPVIQCEMANCKSYWNHNNKKSYFRFPRDDYFCSQWTFACARLDLVDLYLKRGAMYLYKTKKVCEEHFTIENFRNPTQFSQGLFKGVVPTKNLPEFKTVVSISEDQMSRIVEIDPVSRLLPVSSELKKVIEKHKCDQQYSNIVLKKNGQSINKNIVPIKNKKISLIVKTKKKCIGRIIQNI